ncbi:MAG: host-nuclease inhibitor Gam family protein [Peptostreptococcaceae bacterium]|nr:host-nuclease inhibitor Gam family protein [Peptostreptococcaceae bacterium]
MENLETKETFEVRDLQSATWVFRKLREIEEKVDEITAVAIEEKERINDWLFNETKALQQDKEYFEGLLSAYYIQERAKDKRFKLSTPYGKVTTRKNKKWSYDDEVVKEYIKAENLPYIRIKEELDKTSLKKEFKDGINPLTGELVPGITIEEIESITIKAE